VKFIDEAIITVHSGNGGRGCVSFRREKFIPRGGPDGGDGGTGGNVILTVNPNKRTLQHFQYQRTFKAQNGTDGKGAKKTGKKGNDVVIELPPGTLAIDIETGQTIKDFIGPGDTFVIANGGIGGQGNTRFKSSTHRTPRFAQPGEPGQSLTIKLDLKLLADVGIIGRPNAGKSTLIRSITSAKPKTGDYPFTTLTPSLGVVQMGVREPFVIADIPGLIEGAHMGVGLGIKFLRHIERTRILLHLIDISSIDPANPLESFRAINTELAMYNESLVEKLQILVLNKIDLPDAEKNEEIFRSALKNETPVAISALTGTGVDRLIPQVAELLAKLNETQ